MIKLSDGFSVIPEGIYTFRIDSVSYNENFGKMVITLVTADGKKHVERYGLKNQDESINQGALGAFTFLAKSALNDFSLTEIDEQSLVGRYVKGEIVHTVKESPNKPGQTNTFCHIKNLEPADGFDAAAPKEEYDLKALLG